MPIPRLRYSAARTVRLYRRLLQSCADPLRHRLYHPTAGRGQSRVTRCPLFRGKVTDNTIDLKVLVAAGLAAYAFIKVGVEASTPIWVTLALFAFNHFIELQGGRPIASASAVAHA